MFKLTKSIFRKVSISNLRRKKLFFFCIIGNFRKIFIQKKVTFINYPILEQKLVFSGQGMVKIGSNCNFGYKLGGGNFNGCIEIQSRYKDALINIGSNVATNNNVFMCSANYIEIGNNTLIGQNVTFMDHEAHGTHPNLRKQLGKIGEIIVGQNVWIGNNVVILKNTIIGENSIVAAGAVVSGEFPSNVVIGGVPAVIIKKLNFVVE
jgi:acetyltransferase-like isoleucine patch superfamily enzyme